MKVYCSDIELIAFEEGIKDLYLAGKIHSPVHLSKGNEDALIEIFRKIKPEDWVFSTHRSHYHALLKGIPPEWLRAEILNNRSICIHNAEYKFFSSAIVAGCVPIALGVAAAIKRKALPEHAWVFVGDMAAETGIFQECTKYAAWYDLPITFVIEDNGWSVNTPTRETWGGYSMFSPNVKRYKYDRYFPHHGVGKWVNF